MKGIIELNPQGNRIWCYFKLSTLHKHFSPRFEGRAWQQTTLHVPVIVAHITQNVSWSVYERLAGAPIVCVRVCLVLPSICQCSWEWVISFTYLFFRASKNRNPASSHWSLGWFHCCWSKEDGKRQERTCLPEARSSTRTFKRGTKGCQTPLFLPLLRKLRHGDILPCCKLWNSRCAFPSHLHTKTLQARSPLKPLVRYHVLSERDLNFFL